MPSFPNRCQHLKVNGTQCGSPALRRNRFCYFHKRHHEEQVELTIASARSNRQKSARASHKVAIVLPVLEDANSIQVSLMQIMRLLLTGQLEGKVAGLLLYALQTASANLARTNFEPVRQNIILDPATVADTPLGQSVWRDSDFEKEPDPNAMPEYEKRLRAQYGIPRPAPNPPPRAAKRPPRHITAEEARLQVQGQIREALPELMAATAARDNGNRSG
jgi:hypothetical protein